MVGNIGKYFPSLKKSDYHFSLGQLYILNNHIDNHIVPDHRPRGGHLGIFWVGMCCPGLQIGTPF